MRLSLLCALGWLVMGLEALAQETPVDVLAAARSGLLECYSPNTDAKTCRALTTFAFEGEGGAALNSAEVVLGESPLIVMRARSPVTVTANTVCGVFGPEHVEAATFVIDGEPADDETNAGIRETMVAQMGDLLGQEICTTYAATETGMMGDVTIGGAPAGEPPEPVIWVSPDAGYRAGVD